MFENIGKILIIRLSSIGDVVMSLPTIKAIRDRFPSAYIAFAVENGPKEIVIDNPYLDEVIILDFKRWKKNLLKINTWWEILGVIKYIRAKKFNLSINLQLLLRSGLTAYLSSPLRVGYGEKREFNHLLINYKVSKSNSSHTVDRFLNIAKYLGADTKCPEFTIQIPNEDKGFVEQFLIDNNMKEDKPFIVISPGASKEYNIWPAENYAKLIDQLSKGVKIVLVGSKGELSLSERISGLTKNKPIIATGRTNLKQLAHLLQRSALFIGNDSAPMHIAVAMKTKVVAIFGPANPQITGPYGEGGVVVRKDLPCSPCYGVKTCKKYECLTSISVDEVMEAVKKQYVQRY